MSERNLPDPIPTPALLLGLAGLIPFVAAAAAQWVVLPMPSPTQGLQIAVAYGAIILSFLGGIRWGTAIGPYDTGRQAAELSASVLGSLAGFAAIFLPAIPGLSLLIAGFLLQGLWDVMSADAGRLPAWFGRLRMILTAGAVISLIATLARLLLT